eukprot:1411112-Pleurochrysis_carterae.AAC.1
MLDTCTFPRTAPSQAHRPTVRRFAFSAALSARGAVGGGGAAVAPLALASTREAPAVMETLRLMREKSTDAYATIRRVARHEARTKPELGALLVFELHQCCPPPLEWWQGKRDIRMRKNRASWYMAAHHQSRCCFLVMQALEAALCRSERCAELACEAGLLSAFDRLLVALPRSHQMDEHVLQCLQSLTQSEKAQEALLNSRLTVPLVVARLAAFSDQAATNANLAVVEMLAIQLLVSLGETERGLRILLRFTELLGVLASAAGRADAPEYVVDSASALLALLRGSDTRSAYSSPQASADEEKAPACKKLLVPPTVTEQCGIIQPSHSHKDDDLHHDL